MPLHNLEGIACFAWDAHASAALMAACATADVTLSFHNPYGKFLAGVNGFTSGNILLRREQYRVADREEASLPIAANSIAAKIANSRTIVLRAARDHGATDPARTAALHQAADFLAIRIQLARRASTLDSLRGVEGDAAAQRDVLVVLVGRPDGEAEDVVPVLWGDGERRPVVQHGGDLLEGAPAGPLDVTVDLQAGLQLVHELVIG